MIRAVYASSVQGALLVLLKTDGLRAEDNAFNIPSALPGGTRYSIPAIPSPNDICRITSS